MKELKNYTSECFDSLFRGRYRTAERRTTKAELEPCRPAVDVFLVGLFDHQRACHIKKYIRICPARMNEVKSNQIKPNQAQLS